MSVLSRLLRFQDVMNGRSNLRCDKSNCCNILFMFFQLDKFCSPSIGHGHVIIVQLKAYMKNLPMIKICWCARYWEFPTELRNLILIAKVQLKKKNPTNILNCYFSSYLIA